MVVTETDPYVWHDVSKVVSESEAIRMATLGFEMGYHACEAGKTLNQGLDEMLYGKKEEYTFEYVAIVVTDPDQIDLIKDPGSPL